MVRSELGRFSQPDDGRNILGATAPAVFLAAAKPWSETHAPIDIEGSNTFRAMQLVAGEGEKLDAELVDVEGKFAYGLHRVHVQATFLPLVIMSDFPNREKNAGFVVRPQQGDKRGVGTDRAFELLRSSLPRLSTDNQVIS